jgi:hypothetical protein
MGNLNSVARFWSASTPPPPANQDEDEVMVTQVLSQPLEPPREEDDDEVEVTQVLSQPTKRTFKEEDGDKDKEEKGNDDTKAVEISEATLVGQPKAESEGQLGHCPFYTRSQNHLNNTVLRIVRVTARVCLFCLFFLASPLIFFYLLLTFIYTFLFSKIQNNVVFLCPPLHPETRVGYCIRRFCLIFKIQENSVIFANEDGERVYRTQQLSSLPIQKLNEDGNSVANVNCFDQAHRCFLKG